MEALVYGMVTASATVAGGWWMATRPASWLTVERQATLMAMGGGLLLATLGTELLPEAVAHGGDGAFLALVAGIHIQLVEFAAYAIAHCVGESHGCLASSCNPPGVIRVIELGTYAVGSVTVGQHGVDLGLRDQRRVGGLPDSACQRTDGVDLLRRQAVQARVIHTGWPRLPGAS